MSDVDEAALAQYADWLDDLERSDPDGYRRLLAAMKAQVDGGAGDADAGATLLESLGRAKAADEPDGAESFKPRFPGDRVMEASGLAAKHEGMYVDVHPGFVVKTVEAKSGRKVFVNVCFSESIQSFSQQKKLDDEGKEQEGIHVPLSLGAPHEVQDKKGAAALAFDVAVNAQVVEDCRQDRTGSFRHFVCELAIEYIDQKYKIQLDARYKLPRLSYQGSLPPPQHYIRKTQAPIIQEVASKAAPAKTAPPSRSPAPPVSKTSTARYEIRERRTSAAGDSTTALCTRVPAVEKSGRALSRETLEAAGDELEVTVFFETPVAAAADVELELRAELLSVKALGHHDLSVFLPFPVVADSARVALTRARNSLRVSAAIDKSWDVESADSGSAPWLLAQALRSEEPGGGESESAVESARPKSLAEMFHLELSDAREPGASASGLRGGAGTAKWDPVDEDEELPEDRFHRKDMMSMHILEQRKAEREQKAKEADAKRRAQRAEVEAKQREARAVGKSWREMYPNDPETTYLDMDDLLDKQRARQHASPEEQQTDELMPTEDAVKAAAAWSESSRDGKLTLRSALAFELLE